MRVRALALLFVFFSSAQAADTDTLCATVFTYLSEEARSKGMGSSGFDEADTRAQNAHLANDPGEDRQRYAISVIDGAQGLREGLANGSITNDAIVATATSCNSRYYATEQTSQPRIAPR